MKLFILSFMKRQQALYFILFLPYVTEKSIHKHIPFNGIRRTFNILKELFHHSLNFN